MSSITPIGLTYFVAPAQGAGRKAPATAPKENTSKTSTGYNQKQYDDGAKMAKNLIGVTRDYSFTECLIKHEITPHNLVSYMKGYEAYRHYEVEWKGLTLTETLSNKLSKKLGSTRGDKIFEQLRTESNYENKKEMMKKLAQTVALRLKKEGLDTNCSTVNEIIERGEFTKQDAKVLDDILIYLIENTTDNQLGGAQKA